MTPIGDYSDYKGKFLLELYRKALSLPEKELYEYFLDHAVNLTKSKIGFFHFVSDDQKTITLTTWNKEALRSCTANYDTHYPLKQAGNWADCVRIKRPIVYNNFSESPNKKGFPEGHVQITRMLSMPIMEEGKVRAIFAVGNKAALYSEDDVVQLDLVANELNKIIRQRRAEGELRESKEKYYSLFANMLDGFAYCKMIFDNGDKPVDFVYLEVNNAFERLTGLKKEAVIGRKVTEAIPGIKEANPELFDIYGSVALTGKEKKFEMFFKPLSIWLSISVYSPKKGYFAAVFENITAHKETEEALTSANAELEAKVRKRTEDVSNERQRLYSILETLPAYVILLDKNYCVPFSNKVFRERFGESHGRRCYEFLFERSSSCETCETYKVMKTNKPHRWEWTGPDDRNYDIYDFPFVEADGSTLILEMGIDITDRKRAEEQIRESARKLKDAERLAAIGATAGMVGHDIRNPLQAITGDVYLARSDVDSLPESEEKSSLKENLNAIEENVEYINKIVADLQDYSRSLKPSTESVDLEAVINGLLTKNPPPRNIKVSSHIENDVKQIITDQNMLKRILGNLLSNAVQAMPEGGKLSIRAFRTTDDYVITVKDTGVGIPEEATAMMFTPLFTTKSKGQGFGLAVVKRMTETLGGIVAFESHEGKGTTFILRLPSPQ